MLDTLAGNTNRSVDRLTPTGIGRQETGSSHFQQLKTGLRWLSVAGPSRGRFFVPGSLPFSNNIAEYKALWWFLWLFHLTILLRLIKSTQRFPMPKVIQTLADDWENNPANARNWSSERKWIATAVVSVLDFFLRPHFTLLFLHWAVQ